MNFASWVILGIVAIIVGLAVRATFFSGKSKHSCCDVGDGPGQSKNSPGMPVGCASCPGCSESARCPHSS